MGCGARNYVIYFTFHGQKKGLALHFPSGGTEGRQPCRVPSVTQNTTNWLESYFARPTKAAIEDEIGLA